jgi:hypothetical protein
VRWIFVPALALILFGTARRLGPERGAFVDRSGELALGQSARALDPSARLALALRDYGYFATMAGFAAPSQGVVLDDLDPRRDPTQHINTEADLLAAIERSRATLLAYDTRLLPKSPGTELTRAAPSLALVRLELH